MSGGSLDYLHEKVDEAARRCVSSDVPERRAFGRHLVKVAKALHAIEWVDSGDWSQPRDSEAIRAVITPEQEAQSMAADLRMMIEDAKRVLARFDRKEPKP